MKYFFNLLFFVLFSGLAFSQQNKQHKHKITYTNTNNFELFGNSESDFSGSKSTVYNKGFGFELNSFNGFYITRKLVFSVGVGIVYSVNESYKALPIVAQLKWYLNDYHLNGPFILLNTGRNLRIGKFRGGGSAKLGIGYVLESDYDFKYVIGVYTKGKEYILNNQTNFNYNTLSVGISIGIRTN
ncbi:hypothetical protein [Lutibacter sp.]|uniref:hypothetical protein n=1 Tax=Lutibacter sp. TaxID=1925666 RepID=UPI0025BFBAA0|nr:hypothetical protein [Lutibacter sp.]MCF6182515.1 hypothetical protein [Lutibacter sp.]